MSFDPDNRPSSVDLSQSYQLRATEGHEMRLHLGHNTIVRVISLIQNSVIARDSLIIIMQPFIAVK